MHICQMDSSAFLTDKPYNRNTWQRFKLCFESREEADKVFQRRRTLYENARWKGRKFDRLIIKKYSV